MSSSEGFVIERGIPLIEGRGPRLSPKTRALRALAAAEIGASVFLPGATVKKIGPFIMSAAGRGWAACRTVDGGLRVWKIAEPQVAA